MSNVTVNPENQNKKLPDSAKNAVSSRSQQAKFGFRWVDIQWFVIGAMGILTLLLGYVGFVKYFSGKERAPLYIFYYLLQLLTVEQGETIGPVPWELQVARVMAPILAGYTAISGLLAIYREQIRLIFSQCYKDHVIISGLGLKGTLLADDLASQYKVIAIEKDENNPEIPGLKNKGIVVLIGNATDMDILYRAGVHRAKYLISVCGDDGVNAEVAVNAHELIKAYGNKRTRVLTCFIHIYEPELCEFLMEREMAKQKNSNFRLEIFNIFITGARKLLSLHPVEKMQSEKSPHILVIGLGNVGESLIVEAVKRWKSEFAYDSSNFRKLNISLIDQFAYKRQELIEARHPFLEKYCDIKSKQIDINSFEFYNIDLSKGNPEYENVSRIYICLGDDSLGLKTALKLLHKMKDRKISIVVVMTSNSGLANLLRRDTNETDESDYVEAFGLWNMTCNKDLPQDEFNERLAMMFHSEYLNDHKDDDPKVNNAAVPWEELPEHHRETNRRRVDGLYRRLKESGFALKISDDRGAGVDSYSKNEIEILAQKEHERYLEDRKEKGWKYAKKRDEEKKHNPNVTEWENLTPQVQQYNRDDVKKELKLLSRVGFEIYRVKK